MPKFMVEIEIPDKKYEDLVNAIQNKNRKKQIENKEWFSIKDKENVVIPEKYLKKSEVRKSCYAFRLIGVRP